MVALQIRDVPEDVRDALAERAALNGQSQQGFLLGVVLREASFAQSRNLLREVAEWTVGTGVTGDDVHTIIDEGRADRPGSVG